MRLRPLVAGGGEGAGGGGERLERERGDDLGLRDLGPEVADDEAGEAGHCGSAVDERERLLVAERQGWQGDVFGGGAAAIVAQHVALADQRDRHRRERREVAARAKRADLRDRRGDAEVEEIEEPADDLGPDGGVAARQGIRARDHHGARFVARKGLADAGAVAAKQVLLQRAGVLEFHPVLDHLAEAGVHAVDRHAALGERFQPGAVGGHAAEHLGIESHLARAAADGDDIGDGERLAVEQARLGADALLRTVHPESLPRGRLHRARGGGSATRRSAARFRPKYRIQPSASGGNDSASPSVSGAKADSLAQVLARIPETDA